MYDAFVWFVFSTTRFEQMKVWLCVMFCLLAFSPVLDSLAFVSADVVAFILRRLTLSPFFFVVVLFWGGGGWGGTDAGSGGGADEDGVERRI